MGDSIITSQTDPDAGRALPALPIVFDHLPEVTRNAIQETIEAARAERDAQLADLQRSYDAWKNSAEYVGQEVVKERKRVEAAEALVKELGKENEQLLARLTCMCGAWADQHSSQDGHHAVPMYDCALDKMTEERDALRARLDSAQKQEPVAWIDPDNLADLKNPDFSGGVEVWNPQQYDIDSNTSTQVPLYDKPPLLTDSAVFWHGIYPEGGAEMAQEMQRQREVIAGLRAQIADGGEWRTKLTDALAKVMELTLQIEKIKKQPAISELWTNEERKIYSKGGKELIERPELP